MPRWHARRQLHGQPVGIRGPPQVVRGAQHAEALHAAHSCHAHLCAAAWDYRSLALSTGGRPSQQPDRWTSGIHGLSHTLHWSL